MFDVGINIVRGHVGELVEGSVNCSSKFPCKGKFEKLREDDEWSGFRIITTSAKMRLRLEKLEITLAVTAASWQPVSMSMLPLGNHPLSCKHPALRGY